MKKSLIIFLILFLNTLSTNAQTMTFTSGASETGFTFGGWNAATGAIFLSNLANPATVAVNSGTWNFTSFTVGPFTGVNDMEVTSNLGDSYIYNTGVVGTHTLNWVGVTTVTFTRISGGGASADHDNFVYSLTPPAPANDDCSAPTALTVNPDLLCGSTTAGTIENATASAEDPTTCSGTEDDDVWYSFIATATSHQISLINVVGSTTDLYHSVWNATGGCAGLVNVNCSDPNTSSPTGLTIGTTYYVRVYSWTSTPGQTTSFNVCVGTPPPPPANDDCSAPTALTVNADLACGTTTPGTILSATASTEDPTTCNGTEDDDVWFSFTATATSHNVSLINVTGSTTDLYHSVWDATGGCAGLVNINCSDPNTSTASGLTIGTLYYLRVYSWTSTAGQTTSFDVCIGTAPAGPVNDICSGAIPITPSAAGTGCGTATFTLPFATDGTTDSGVPTVCSNPGLDQWFTWTATSTGLAWNDQSPGNPGIAVFANCADAAAGTEIACLGTFADGNLSGWNIGDNLLIQIYDFAGSSSDVAFCLEEFTAPSAPANDDCSAPTALTVNADLACGSTTSGTIAAATASAEDATACSGTEDDDVWFSFVATATSHQIDLLNLTGGTTDLYHSIWEGTCGSLTLVAGTCSDPNSSSPSGLTIGNTYYLRVYSWTSTTGQTTSFDVCVGTLPPPPANDEIAGSIAVTCGSVTAGSTVSATQGVDETGGTCVTSQSSAGGLWYSFVGTGDYITADVCIRDYDTKLFVYTGTTGALTCVTGNDDFCGTGSQVEFQSLVGTTYHILVNGFSTNTGTFSLTIGCANAWTGTTDTDWSTMSNWSQAIPTSTDNVIIPDVSSASGNFPTITPSVTLADVRVDAGASLTVAAGMILDGTFTNNGMVTLQDGAYLDDFSSGTGSFVGDVTVERLVSNGAGNDQRFISSPVNTPNVSEIGDDLNGPFGAGLTGTDGVAVTIDDCALQTVTTGSNYGNMFEFDESLIATCALDGWVVRSAGTLTNGAGYSAYLTSGSTFEMNGTPNSGDVIIPVTNSGSGLPTGEGWNLIGNPYPSPISRDDVITAGVTDAQYYEASGPYQGTFTPYMPTSNIAIAQGFQVQTAATGSITLTDAMRNTGASTWYSSSSWFTHKLDVIVEGNTFADKTILFYNEDATINYEAMYDVSKRPSSLGQPTLSTFFSNKELALNGMPINSLGETVPMHFDAGTDGSYTLSFEGMETFPANTTIYVKDLQENVVHNIADGDYTFASTTSDNAGRFEIIFVPEVTFTTTAVDCQGNEGSLQLSSANFTDDRSFEISNDNGVLNSDNLVNLNESLTAGSYTVNVNDQYGGMQTYTIVVESAESIEANLEVSNTEVLVGEVVSLNNITTNSNAVNWSVNGSSIGSVNILTYSFETAGTYEVEMMVSNDECSDVKTITIEVAHKTTGIETIAGQEINFYPNPATTVLHVESDINIVVEMMDVLGKKLIRTSDKSINLENIPSGIYFLNVYDESNQLIGTEKIIKK